MRISRNKKKLTRKQKMILIAGMIILTIIIYKTAIEKDRTSDLNAKTDTSPACYETAADLLDALEQNPKYESLCGMIDDIGDDDYGMIVIPGLDCMKTLNLTTREIDSCAHMTPQGMAIVEDYLIISAYCHRGDHASVIMVLDRRTGKFIKEIPLDGKPHVGGVAYDPEHEIVWVSGNVKLKASAIGLSLNDIEAYDSEKMDGPIHYTFEEILPEIKSNSFMTFYDGVLYVGYFRLAGKSVIKRYAAAEDGSLIHIEKQLSLLKKIGEFFQPKGLDTFARIPAQIQGITFLKQRLLMTQSYGPVTSKLLLSDEIDLTDTNMNLTKKHLAMNYTFPEYLESACYSEEEDQIYFLFEGAAHSYRWKADVPMDRIICLHLNY